MHGCELSLNFGGIEAFFHHFVFPAAAIASAALALKVQLPTFRAAYAKRRCIVPVDCFFDWRATKRARAKQPYAVAMKDRTPFAIAGLWENWHHPESGDWIRTFVILTVPANELVAQIHDRMPLILPKIAYER